MVMAILEFQKMRERWIWLGGIKEEDDDDDNPVWVVESTEIKTKRT